MAKKGKYVEHKGTVRALLENAPGEVTDLKDEMGEWRDNMEGNNMDHLPKFDEVSEAADLLETAEQEIEDAASELVSALEGADDEKVQKLLDETVKYTEFQPYKGRRLSRSNRLSNTIAQWQAAAEFVKDEVEQMTEDEDVLDNDVISACETLVTACEDAENVCFPGMY